jgi:hypothetical protein
MPHFTGLLDRRERVEVLRIGHASEGLGTWRPVLRLFCHRIDRHKAVAVRRIADHPAHDLVCRVTVVDDRFVVVRRGERRLSAIELAIQPVDPFTFGTVVEVLVVKPGETHTT